MTAITYDGNTPTVNGDANVWGGELNTALTQVKADLDMLNASPTARFLGRTTAGTGEVERLTAAQATALLNAVVAATQSTAGTKGIVPQPPAASQNKPLCGDGTFKAGVGRFAGGCVSISGATTTLTGALNCTVSTVTTVTPSIAYFTVTFTNAYGSTNYAVAPSSNDLVYPVGIDNKASGSFRLYFNPNTTAIDFSVF